MQLQGCWYNIAGVDCTEDSAHVGIQEVASDNDADFDYHDGDGDDDYNLNSRNQQPMVMMIASVSVKYSLC